MEPVKYVYCLGDDRVDAQFICTHTKKGRCCAPSTNHAREFSLHLNNCFNLDSISNFQHFSIHLQ